MGLYFCMVTHILQWWNGFRFGFLTFGLVFATIVFGSIFVIGQQIYRRMSIGSYKDGEEQLDDTNYSIRSSDWDVVLFLGLGWCWYVECIVFLVFGTNPWICTDPYVYIFIL